MLAEFHCHLRATVAFQIRDQKYYITTNEEKTTQIICAIFMQHFSVILSSQDLMAELSQKVFWRSPSFPTSCECSITMATIIYSVNSSGDQYPLLAPSLLGLEFHQEFTNTLLRNQKKPKPPQPAFCYLDDLLPLRVICL